MPASKPIQLILSRQLASCMATAIMLFDAQGNLVFYNEAAEPILNSRFDETGEIKVDDLLRVVTVADENRELLPPEARPGRVARLERRPITQTIWMSCNDGPWRRVQATAVPVIGEQDELHGVMQFFWEV
ncbi:MAG TPA: PAS domain-containing protein [Casimicrobiaceae bacterium]|nr:PAS domain-containing protein [Casimicrobiaceae bacterium]